MLMLLDGQWEFGCLPALAEDGSPAAPDIRARLTIS